jgi:hypothetical protein
MASKRSMNSPDTLNPQVLDEDLRIIRATLATITGAVYRQSEMAGVALETALAQLDLANRLLQNHAARSAADRITPDSAHWA